MTSRSRVLVSINSSWNILHFRGSLLRALTRAGYAVESAAPVDEYTSRLRALVARHHDLPMDNAGTNPIRDVGLFLRYVGLLARTRPSVLLTYTIKPNIYGALAAGVMRVPVIANVSGLGTAFIHDGIVTRIACGLYRLAFRSAATVFFQNPEDRELFIARGLVNKTQAVLLPGSGIDLEHYAPRAEAAEAQSFVLIARLLYDKGIGEYVEAARMLKAKYPNARFRLLGPRGVLNQTAIDDATLAKWQAEGVIEYLGETEDVRDTIARHACVVLPSYREGLPRTLLEAAAMGKPLIASDVAGCRELVKHGENGLLAAARDAAGLAAAMEQFLALSDAERTEMGRKSRAIAERDYDERIVIDAYLKRIAALTAA